MADIILPSIPLTLLDAVNVLLRSVGLAEVDSLLDADANVDSQNAFTALGRANGQIQAGGWYCNTEDFTLTPDTGGNIEIPPNYLRVRPQRGTQSWALRLTTRACKLYNLKDHTFTFTSAQYLNVVQSLAFEDLPEQLRWYITCRAGRSFGVGTMPSAATFKFTEDEEITARAAAEVEDGQLRDDSLPETSPHFGKMRRR